MDAGKKAEYGESKQGFDVESVPVFDDDGPVEFEEKAELRYELSNRISIATG